MRVEDGADKNEVSYTELEQSYKWARNETERERERENELNHNRTIIKLDLSTH